MSSGLNRVPTDGPLHIMYRWKSGPRRDFTILRDGRANSVYRSLESVKYDTVAGLIFVVLQDGTRLWFTTTDLNFQVL